MNENIRHWGILEISPGLTENNKAIQRLIGPFESKDERDSECIRLNKKQEGIKYALRKSYYRANCINSAADANDRIKQSQKEAA